MDTDKNCCFDSQIICEVLHGVHTPYYNLLFEGKSHASHAVLLQGPRPDFDSVGVEILAFALCNTTSDQKSKNGDAKFSYP